MNGTVSETSLCAKCAEKHGVGSKNLFVNMGIDGGEFGIPSDGIFGGLFAGMSDDHTARNVNSPKVCPKCGMRFSDFLHDGKIGCGECYKTFSSSLMPAIKRIHGSGGHCGKIPEGKSKEIGRKRKIEELRLKLKQAIETQEYEMAAKYRDEIRALESEDQSGAGVEGEGK